MKYCFYHEDEGLFGENSLIVEAKNIEEATEKAYDELGPQSLDMPCQIIAYGTQVDFVAVALNNAAELYAKEVVRTGDTKGFRDHLQDAYIAGYKAKESEAQYNRSRHR